MDPTSALSGVQTGHICDSCNKTIQSGDIAIGYATVYEGEGWVLRRTWCEECGGSEIDVGTNGADEVLIEAVFWRHSLAAVDVLDRSRPSEGQPC
jgi:hypothetical protein